MCLPSTNYIKCYEVRCCRIVTSGGPACFDLQARATASSRYMYAITKYNLILILLD
jgi:hypothetical protein